MSVDFTVVSIGTLSSNPFWNEPPGLRTAHATTTLVRDADRRILVDPSLPALALVARLFERTGLRPEAITDVFCTTLRPTHRRSLSAFPRARWVCGEEELSACRQHLEATAGSAERAGPDAARALRAERDLLERFAPAAEKMTPSVHLFPLPGPSVGSCGLLLADAIRTIVVAGDAALTADHVTSGRVWEGSTDVDRARASLTDLLEISDVIVCGHDNYMLGPLRWAP